MGITAERLAKGTKKIASLPQLYQKVAEALRDKAGTNRSLGRIISKDPGLASRLLQMTNSAFYASRARVETVEHAISIIGRDDLQHLVLACSMVAMFKNIPQQLISMDEFWKHSIACGVLARTMAKARNDQHFERFFIGGLLHDIGKLIFLVELPQVVLKMYKHAREKKILMHHIEARVLSFDHAKLGGALLKEWALPPRLREMVRYHHSPLDALYYPNDAAIIHISDIMANALRWGTSGEQYVPPVHENAWGSLKLNASAMGELMEKARPQYEDAVKIIL